MAHDSQETVKFPPDVAKKLGVYVYRLIDPRNGETFYVGKGKDNRVFAHIREQVDDADPDNKLKRIREIRRAGFEVAHVIHRHGMDEKTALEVEAALIDAYPGLTNIASGLGASAYGVMHVKEIIDRYAAPEAVIKHKAMLISVNKTAAEKSLYEAARYAWKVDVNRARQAELVLATVQGVIRGAFVPEKWLAARSRDFPGHEDVPGRFGFVGHEASDDLARQYIGRRVPEKYRKRGAAFPVKYTWGKGQE